MCGIAGFVGDLNSEQANSNLKKMSEPITHRGPDSSGFNVNVIAKLGFAHTRLSILDLSPHGHQPMFSKSERFLITYNGEIYNFKELAKKLEQKGYQLNGHSDTEVLVNFVEAFGLQETLKQVCGMFAFGLYDKEENKLTLVRDRAGEKPLYYHLSDNGLVFSSELKAIRNCVLWKDDIDPDNLGLFMRHNYIPAPFSIYKKTYKLPAGCCLEIPLDQNMSNISSRFSPASNSSHSGDDISPKSYWSLSEVVSHRKIIDISEQTAVEGLEAIVDEVITQQMISDVPLGAFLSGGVDSSLVAAIMQKLSTNPVKTFSIGFTEDHYNEAHHAKAVAKHLKTDHTELYVTPKETLDVVPKIAEMYDEPFADSSQIPTHLVSKLAKQHVTVSLSGDGGDELFGGYNRYFLATKVWNKLGAKPLWVRQSVIALIYALKSENWDRVYKILSFILPKNLQFKQFGDKLYKTAKTLQANSALEMYLNIISHWKNTQDIVPLATRTWSILDRVRVEDSKLDFKELMMFLDFCTYLTDDILAKVDRAAMAVSLETRIPLLDKRVIEYAWSLPLGMKIKNGQGKWILKEVLYKHVPRELIERPKMGFGIPVGEWIKGPLNEWASDLLSKEKIEKSGHLNYEVIQQRWNEHLQGKNNWQMSLWNVLVYQQWYEANYS